MPRPRRTERTLAPSPAGRKRQKTRHAARPVARDEVVQNLAGGTAAAVVEDVAIQETASTGGVATITYSIRLTDQQRDRLVEAAQVRGWTPTALIRIAALEKAAHILNISRPTTFNFKQAASLAADHLAKPRLVLQHDEATDSWFSEVNEKLQVDPPSLSAPELARIKRAAHLGGNEFLNLVVDFCEGLLAPEPQLTEPLDPGLDS